MSDRNECNFRVGSRKSDLALIQTKLVIEQLKVANGANYNFSIVTMDTIGDKILDKPLPKIGEKSLFTQELEKALEDGEVDFVVHSLKDLPTVLPEKKVIGAILKRVDPRDCVLVHEKHKNFTLQTLPEGSCIGTSSLRRTAQISRLYPHLRIESIRGNMNTRVKKLNDGLFDAIVVAVAGCKRMNWMEKINEILDCEDIMYAVGQGALAVECMEDNEKVLKLLAPLVDRDTVLSVSAERSFLRKLEGGCSAPVAVNCSLTENVLQLKGLVCSLDGKKSVRETAQIILSESGEATKCGEGDGRASYCGLTVGSTLIDVSDMVRAEKLGEDLANQLIANGALLIMAEARKQVTNDISK